MGGKNNDNILYEIPFPTDGNPKEAKQKLS